MVFVFVFVLFCSDVVYYACSNCKEQQQQNTCVIILMWASPEANIILKLVSNIHSQHMYSQREHRHANKTKVNAIKTCIKSNKFDLSAQRVHIHKALYVRCLSASTNCMSWCTPYTNAGTRSMLQVESSRLNWLKNMRQNHQFVSFIRSFRTFFMLLLWLF